MSEPGDNVVMRWHIEAVWGVRLPELEGTDLQLVPDSLLPRWKLYAAELRGVPVRIWRPDVPEIERTALLARLNDVLAMPMEATQHESRDQYNGWTAQPQGRGTIDIIWSCVFTIFLSCWTHRHSSYIKKGLSRLGRLASVLKKKCLVVRVLSADCSSVGPFRCSLRWRSSTTLPMISKVKSMVLGSRGNTDPQRPSGRVVALRFSRKISVSPTIAPMYE